MTTPLKLEPCPAHTEGRRESDAYPTPRWCTRLLLAACPPRIDWPVVEPFAGTGAIVEPCLEAGCEVNAVELREECGPALLDVAARQATSVFSFHTGDWFRVGESLRRANGKPHIWPRTAIVTNPPYSIAAKCVRSCLETGAGYVAMLLRLGFFASLDRSRLINRHPPTQLLVLGKRPSFTGDGNTDIYDYCFAVWERDARPRALRVLVP